MARRRPPGCQLPEHLREARRAGHEADRLHLLRERRAALVGGFGERMAPLYRDLHQRLRPAALDVREQFSSRQGDVQLPGDVERLQAHRRRLLRRREDGVVQRRREEGLSLAAMTIPVAEENLGGREDRAQ